MSTLQRSPILARGGPWGMQVSACEKAGRWQVALELLNAAQAFRVQGPGKFRVLSLRFGGSGLRVQGLSFRVQGLGIRV